MPKSETVQEMFVVHSSKINRGYDARRSGLNQNTVTVNKSMHVNGTLNNLRKHVADMGSDNTHNPAFKVVLDAKGFNQIVCAEYKLKKKKHEDPRNVTPHVVNMVKSGVGSIVGGHMVSASMNAVVNLAQSASAASDAARDAARYISSTKYGSKSYLLGAPSKTERRLAIEVAASPEAQRTLIVDLKPGDSKEFSLKEISTMMEQTTLLKKGQTSHMSRSGLALIAHGYTPTAKDTVTASSASTPNESGEGVDTPKALQESLSAKAPSPKRAR